MDLSEITPLILTWNEEPNIGRCLERLAWARRVVVLDSGSKDETLAICARFPQVEVVHRAFDNHTAQWNHALAQSKTRWVLTLDADYLLNETFLEEVRALKETDQKVAWFVPFRFLVFGHPLRGSLYPPRAALFNRDACRFVPDGHTQLLQMDGPSGSLRSRIDHDDRKPLSRWLDSQLKYARLEAEMLEKEPSPKGLPDRLRRKIWPTVPTILFYTLFVKRVILDGWPGWFYVLQRLYAEILLSLLLLEKRIFKN